ncbi:hypothetical protein B0H17DRAFT_856614, partial [Mycena rosella]
HYRLWHRGIKHSDISATNLLYRCGNPNVVVLNDFDLAHLGQDDVHLRTRTIEFMALQLLTQKGLEGEIPRSYRHDL